MSRLFVNSVANVGKLMRNVGTSSHYPIRSKKESFVKHLEDNYEFIKKLKKIGSFDVASLKKQFSLVKLEKDLPNMKVKIMFDLETLPGTQLYDFWSNLEILEKKLNLKKCEDVILNSENEFTETFYGMDQFMVELDKGEDENLTFRCKFNADKKGYKVKEFRLMNSYTYVHETRLSNNEEAMNLAKKLLEEYGVSNNLGLLIENWMEEFSEGYKKVSVIRKFLMS